ncbi:antitermination protein [Trabulsiella odontotermitis]|uniref:Molecular chaperone n=1 Tax=Trabulsiella odontotermitis TaxID=379893 RepID=A0A0L0GYC8_9ENTR|nr:antitermination protein [Trabulsiella odontotermitis]KNC93759.1 molecular chaperone [Trabulsiella odontotermitis]
MKLENLPKYFAPKSMIPGAVPCGVTSDTLTITDVMAALGLATSKASVGIELYLAKAGVLTTDNITAYIEQLAILRSDRHKALRKMPEAERYKFLRTIARYAFRDYSLSAASLITCNCCHGARFIDAEVFTNKVNYPDGKPPEWVKDTKGIRPSDWEVWRSVREPVKLICKPCDGKGYLKNECRCRGRGEVIDKKQSELQGVPVMKQCPRCSGRGYPRLTDTEIYTELGIPKTTWGRNYKQFFDLLVEYCHIEESYAEKVLYSVTI